MTRLPRPAVAIIIILLVIPASAATTPTARAIEGAPQGYGLEFGHVIDDAGAVRFTDEIAARIVAAGASWVRINFRLGGFADWTETTTFGVSALARYDEIVATAQRHNLLVVGLLSNETWHGPADAWRANSAEAAGGNGDNPYLRAFVEQAALLLVQHFAGRVSAWEVWNEPNVPATALYPSNFAHLLARLYTGARERGLEETRFISGGLSSVQADDGSLTPASTGAAYLAATYARGKELAGWEEIRAAHGSYPLDAIGQHLYVDGYRRTSRAAIRAALELVHAAAADGEQGGETPPTVVTEVGWSSANVPERVQADNLQIAFAEIMATPWVTAASWFFLRDEPAARLAFGLLRHDSSAKPTWQAYQIITIPSTPPLAPTGTSAAGFPAGILLEWQISVAPDLAGYHIYRAPSPSGPFTQLTTEPLTTPSFFDPNAPLGAPAYYRVAAVDHDGNLSDTTEPFGAMRLDQAELEQFTATWTRTDLPVAEAWAPRTWMWGASPLTGVLTEQYADAPGGLRRVQYFDKSRMELTDPAADPADPWTVTNGLLVVELMTGRMQVGDAAFIERAPAQVNVAGDPSSGPTYAALAPLRWSAARTEGQVITARVDAAGRVTTDERLAAYAITTARHVPETRHTIAQPFWELMNATGVIAEGDGQAIAPLFQNPFYATGYPITEAYWTNVLVAGIPMDVLVQCFERRCLTYTPDNPAGWQIEAGNVGQHYYRWRYGLDPPAPSQ